jgi:hypothetical protein
MRPATALLWVAAAVVLVSGCTMGRVERRMQYWQEETHKHLPVGTPLADAQTFFATRGLKLVCCLSAEPRVPKSRYASERNVGQFLWMKYNVVVLVKMSAENQVESVQVERWGVGF